MFGRTSIIECRGPSRREFLKIGALCGAWSGNKRSLAVPRPRRSGWSSRQGQGGDFGLACGRRVAHRHLRSQAGRPRRRQGRVQADRDQALRGVLSARSFPKLAGSLDRFTLVRSMTSPEADHDRAAHHLLTGYRPNPSLVYPSYGSVVSRIRADVASELPPYVAVPDAPLFSSSGYLSPAYDPFSVESDPNSAGFRVRNLTPPDRLTLDRLRRRRDMIRKVDAFATEISPTPLTESRDKFIDQAYELLTSTKAQGAFKIDSEADGTRERYGRNPFGQACLLARRLVESGVPFVTINDRGMAPARLGYAPAELPNDQEHPRPAARSRRLGARRRPRGARASRDHAGHRHGRVRQDAADQSQRGPRPPRPRQLRSCSRAEGFPPVSFWARPTPKRSAPIERAVTPADLAATLYTALGIDPRRQFETPDGRPVRLVEGGTAIKELISV